MAVDMDQGRPGLPRSTQQALDAYVGTQREAERRFLHDVMGVDLYA